MDGTEGEPKVKKKKVNPGSFRGMGLSQPTLKAVIKMGYSMPTPIQRRTIPVILEGQDMVAMARTGSGKSAAFLIPILEQLGEHSVSVGIRAAVLSPTRELAMQTAKFFRLLGRFRDLRCVLLVGGQGMEMQFGHLANNPDVVVATPGRLMHHILEADLSLSRVQVLVFDEADRLFELGFAEQLQKTLDATPLSRQCLLFSATLPQQLVSFSRAGLKNPMFVRLDVESTLSDALKLWFLYMRNDEKIAAAVSVLRHLQKEQKTTIMFVATKHHVEFFGELLGELGLSVAVVYGSMDQWARTQEVSKFRHRRANILVTTDVAARGIDIPFLDHVLNFDFPPSAKLFVHRSGRTARLGRSGICASLVTLDDLPYAVELMLFLGRQISIAEPVEGVPVLGAVPGLEVEVETINQLLAEEGTVLSSLHKSMMASYKLYYKTRRSASRQSTLRAKRMLEDCGGAARLQSLVHPALKDMRPESQSKADGSSAYIQELRGFRPRVEKKGNVLSTVAMRTMDQAKLDAAAMHVARDTQQVQEDMALITPGAKAPPEPVPEVKVLPRERERARMSKRRRLKQGAAGAAAATFEGWDVAVDGQALNADAPPAKGKEKAPQFYLSVDRDLSKDAKERGLDMEQYQMDLMPDDSGQIKRAKSVMRWDAKKKKFLPTMVAADGRVLKRSKQKNESGKTVTGEAQKSKIYLKWTKSSKRRIQNVGELEQQKIVPLSNMRAAALRQTVAFNDGGEQEKDKAADAKPKKPVVPFHGVVGDKFLTHRQQRLLKKRARMDTVGKGTGSKRELKTPQDLQRENRIKHRKKVKATPKLRAKEHQDYLRKNRKKIQEKSLKLARTKSKMLIIEGPRRATFHKKKIKNGRGGSLSTI